MPDEAAAPVAKSVAQHIAFADPQWRTRADVPADVVAHETEVFCAQTLEEGKPEAALPKFVEGRMNGFYKENVLEEQALAQDSKTTVAKHVAATGGNVLDFARVKVGA